MFKETRTKRKGIISFMVVILLCFISTILYPSRYLLIFYQKESRNFTISTAKLSTEVSSGRPLLTTKSTLFKSTDIKSTLSKSTHTTLSPSDRSRQFAEKIRKHVQDDSLNVIHRLQQYMPDNKVQSSNQLDEHLVPNAVFYVWCGRRRFEFNHYLSVLSVVRYIQPDSIVFYYESYPEIDDKLYNTWFLEIMESLPYFRTEEVHDKHACHSQNYANKSFVKGLVDKQGGIYINESTILNSFPISCRQNSETTISNSGGSLAALIAKVRNARQTTDQHLESKVKTACYRTCITRKAAEEVKNDTTISCLQLLERTHPKDIWTMDNSFGRLVRTLFYGTPEMRQAKSSNDTLVPNIAHLVWLGGGQMDFLFYLNILSLIYVAKVDMVYIHGDGPPTGDYWNILKNNAKLKLIYRSAPKSIYGTPVGVKSHVSDAWRVDIMIKYGGIYIDVDAVFVKPLDAEIRSYDAVATYDWWKYDQPFPNVINFGVTIGKRNALFWRKFQSTLKWFIDGDWSWNGLRQPYRVFERNPELLKIDPRLQVTCFFEKCHPTWYPNYGDDNIHHLNSPSIKNWREDAYTFHWTTPNPWELQNHKVLLQIKNDTIFSEIGKFILEKAGMTEHFKRTL